MAAKSSSTADNSNWAPPAWDILKGAGEVEKAVARKAAVREVFNPIELGGDAGRAVLDQYSAARGETNKGGAVRTVLSFQNLTNTVAIVLPLAGLAAAVGVDAVVFGSAAQHMTKPEDLPFDPTMAFAVGSLIFASALGLSEKYNNSAKKAVLYGTLFVASAGASFIAAGDDEFRANFTKPITAAFGAGYDNAQIHVATLQQRLNDINAEIDWRDVAIRTKGKNGNPMLKDGDGSNDDKAKEYDKKIIEYQTQKKTVQAELASAVPALENDKKRDWTDLTGRLLAASYIAAWLIAAQLLVSEVVHKAANNVDELRDKIVGNRRQKKFVQDLENPDEAKRMGAIRGAVQVMLSRFSESLSTSMPENASASRKENLAKLFDDENYPKMVDAGVSMVVGAITPRAPSLWQRVTAPRTSFNEHSEVKPVAAESPIGQKTEANDNVVDGPANEAKESSVPKADPKPNIA